MDAFTDIGMEIRYAYSREVGGPSSAPWADTHEYGAPLITSSTTGRPSPSTCRGWGGYLGGVIAPRPRIRGSNLRPHHKLLRSGGAAPSVVWS